MPLSQLRAAREVRVEPLDPPVVEREDVVLDRLDQEEPLELGQLARVARPPGRGPGSSPSTVS